MRAAGRALVRLAGWRTKGRTFGECGGKTEATTVVFPFSRSLAPSPSIRYFSLSPSLSGSPRPPARAHRFASTRSRSAPDPSPSPHLPLARSHYRIPARSFVLSPSFSLDRAIANSSSTSAPLPLGETATTQPTTTTTTTTTTVTTTATTRSANRALWRHGTWRHNGKAAHARYGVL